MQTRLLARTAELHMLQGGSRLHMKGNRGKGRERWTKRNNSYTDLRRVSVSGYGNISSMTQLSMLITNNLPCTDRNNLLPKASRSRVGQKAKNGQESIRICDDQSKMSPSKYNSLFRYILAIRSGLSVSTVFHMNKWYKTNGTLMTEKSS